MVTERARALMAVADTQLQLDAFKCHSLEVGSRPALHCGLVWAVFLVLAALRGSCSGLFAVGARCCKTYPLVFGCGAFRRCATYFLSCLGPKCTFYLLPYFTISKLQISVVIAMAFSDVPFPYVLQLYLYLLVTAIRCSDGDFQS